MRTFFQGQSLSGGEPVAEVKGQGDCNVSSWGSCSVMLSEATNRSSTFPCPSPQDVNRVAVLCFCHSDGGTAGAPPQTSASRCHRPCLRQQPCHQPRWEQGLLAAVCSPGPTGCRLTPGSEPSLQPVHSALLQDASTHTRFIALTLISSHSRLG